MIHPTVVLVLKLLGGTAGVGLFIYLASKYIFSPPKELIEVANHVEKYYLDMKRQKLSDAVIREELFDVITTYYEDDQVLTDKDIDAIVDEVMLYLDDKN